MNEALHSGHAPLLEPPASTGRQPRVQVSRKPVAAARQEVPPRRGLSHHLRENLEPLLFAAMLVLAVVAYGLWSVQVPPPSPAASLQATPSAGPTAKAAPSQRRRIPSPHAG